MSVYFYVYMTQFAEGVLEGSPILGSQGGADSPQKYAAWLSFADILLPGKRTGCCTTITL